MMLETKHLSDAGVDYVFDRVHDLIAITSNHGVDRKRALMEKLLPVLNELDSEDVFGTEGWAKEVGLA